MPSAFDWLVSKKRSLSLKKGIKFSPTAKTITWLLILAFVIFVFKFSSQIIHPFIWAMITAYLFAPLINKLEMHTRVHRAFWILGVYVVIGLILYWALSFAVPILNNEVREIVGNTGTNPTILGNLENVGKGSIFGIEVNIQEGIRNFELWMVSQAKNFAVPMFFSVVERLILISAYFIITFYLLLDGEKYIRLFLLLFPTAYRKEATAVANQINETLGTYIRGQVILIIIMSLASWTILSTLKVGHPFILALSTGVLEVVPIIGPIVATTLVAIVAFNQTVFSWGLTNVTLTMIVIAAYFILRQLEDLIIIPNVVGRFIHVHPVVVMFALFIGAKVGGVLGIFLALPVSAVLKVIFNYLYPKLVN